MRSPRLTILDQIGLLIKFNKKGGNYPQICIGKWLLRCPHLNHWWGRSFWPKKIVKTSLMGPRTPSKRFLFLSRFNHCLVNFKGSGGLKWWLITFRCHGHLFSCFKMLFEFCRNDKNVGIDGNFEFLFCRHIRQPWSSGKSGNMKWMI